jgi:hypothetical protein
MKDYLLCSQSAPFCSCRFRSYDVIFQMRPVIVLASDDFRKIYSWCKGSIAMLHVYVLRYLGELFHTLSIVGAYQGWLLVDMLLIMNLVQGVTI